jgi:hypothetical protein
MAGHLSREEEKRLVAEAEAVYASGGYEPAQLRRVNLVFGPKMLGMIVEQSQTMDEARQLGVVARERGISVGQLLNDAIRSYAGLPPRDASHRGAEAEDVQDRERARP